MYNDQQAGHYNEDADINPDYSYSNYQTPGVDPNAIEVELENAKKKVDN